VAQLRTTAPVLLLATLTATAGWTVPAGAQTGLPETGTTTNIGDLRQQIEGLYSFGTGTPGTPGWTVVPSIGLSEQWTDNSRSSSGKKQNSFITVINPAVLVNADTDRVKGTLSLAPSAYIYANDSSQNQFNSNLNGNARVTLLPEHLFLTLQGYSAVQATSGGLGPSNTTTLNRQNATQNYAFSATPTLRERFEDIGTGELGASYMYTSQQNLSSSSNGAFQATGGSQATGLNQFMIGTREYVTFTSGPVLGRTAVTGLGSAMQMNGTGVSNHAYRNLATIDVGYAITRSITALGTIGWEDIRYDTDPVYRINDAVWKVGVHWVPNPDSTLTLRYGHVDGFNQPWFDGSYALTARTRLYGSYSETLSSALESLQSAASTSVLDPLGNPIDPVTGAPLLLTNNFFSVQNNNVLYRLTNASLTATTLFDRDAVSLTVSYQDRKPVAQTANAGGSLATNGPTSGTYGAINWQHDLSPELRTAAYVQYGTTENSTVTGNQTSDSVVASLSLTYVFSETLTGLAQYSFSSNQSRFGGQSSPTNLVVIGVRKTF
jgi:uncharacterized protein (PEP-CTERM system associated)